MTNSKETQSAPENSSFEASFEKLQAAVKKLESGELSLEQSLQQFEEGVRLTRVCQEYLQAAEQKVDLLIKASADGQVNLQTFSPSKL